MAKFKHGATWTAEPRIPYTAVKGQTHSINGVDHGRYSVSLNGAKLKTIYLLSEPERVIKRFEEWSLGTVVAWS
ncbi:MAG: hypothetical protein ACFCD0_21700 [Gemmataceae bacterium]